MARGKYLSLEEARKSGKLKQFSKEHPAEGDERLFDRLLGAMASGKKPSKRQTSSEASSAGCDETRTPQDSSEDVS